MSNDKITGLAAEACDLKKAWVLGMALVGKPTSIPLSHLNMPSYAHWQAKPLKRQIADLEHGLDEIGKKFILEDWSSVRLNKPFHGWPRNTTNGSPLDNPSMN